MTSNYHFYVYIFKIFLKSCEAWQAWQSLQHQPPPPEQERYLKSFTWGSKSDLCPEEQFNLTDRKEIEFLNHHFLKSYENVVRLWLRGSIFARIARMPWINVRHSCSRSCLKICLYNGLPQDEVRPIQTHLAVLMPSRLVLAKRRADICFQYFVLFYIQIDERLILHSSLSFFHLVSTCFFLLWISLCISMMCVCDLPSYMSKDKVGIVKKKYFLCMSHRMSWEPYENK